mgnify:FL=1
MPSPLTIAFRQQFPQGSILSEVLTIYDGLFVVRVSVQVEGAILSQALGGNNSLELAEDIACNRAIERLSLDITQPDSTSAAPHPEAPQKAQTSPNFTAHFSPSGRAQPSSEAPEDKSRNPQLDRVTPSADSSPVSTDVPASTTAPSSNRSDGRQTSEATSSPTVEPDPAMPQETAFPKLSLATPPAPKLDQTEQPPAQEDTLETERSENREEWGYIESEPIDLSDIIAQTDVELQRLGWDVHQGREFLEKTYSKRSRHDLTDEELLEFLLHLESQPTPSVN